MFDFLRKKLEETLADINPFDNGRSGADVRAERNKPAPARTISQPQRKPLQLGNQPNTSMGSLNAPKLQSNIQPTKISMPQMPKMPDAQLEEKKKKAIEYVQRTGKPAPSGSMLSARPEDRVDTSVLNKDEVNQALKQRVQKAAGGAPMQRAINQVGTGVKDFAQGAVRETSKGINTANAGVVKPIYELSTGVDPSTVKRNMERDLYTGKGGVANAGTFFQTKDRYKQVTSNPLEFAKGFTGAGVAMASEVAPVFRGTNLLAKPALNAGQKVMRGAAEGAAYGAAGDAGSQFIQKGSIDPTQVAMNAASGAVLGGAVPAIGAAVRPTTRLVKNAATDLKTNAVSKAAEDASGLPRLNVLNDNEAYTLADYADIAMKRYDAPNDVRNKIVMQARQAANRAGFDITNMTPADANRKISEYLQARDTFNTSYKSAERTMGQGGFAKIPGAPEQPSVPMRDINGRLTESPLVKRPQPTTKLVIPKTESSLSSLPTKEGSQSPLAPALASTPEAQSLRLAQLSSLEQSGIQSNPGYVKQGSSIETSQPQLSLSRRPESQQLTQNPYSGSVSEAVPISKVIDMKVKRSHGIKVKQPRGNRAQEYVAVQSNDASGNAMTELVPLDQKRHQLKNGMVVDKEGKSVGSYLAINEDGQQIAYVEGKPMNITNITGDVDAWANVNKAFTDMDRLIETNAPDAATAKRVQNFTTVFKDRQEAAMKADLFSRRKELASRERDMLKALPDRRLRKDLSADMFRIMEKKVGYNEMYAKYGKDYVDNVMIPNAKWARTNVFDEILAKTNKVLERNGFDPIPRRDDYITHIQEDPKFFEKVGIGIQDLGLMGKSISSDVNPGSGRGALPDEIAGLTENTRARRKWNPFAQSRKGEQTKQDFFESIDKYLEPMLFNQYMTPASSRVRVIEKAFRLNEKAKQAQYEKLVDALGEKEAKKKIATGKARHKKFDPNATSKFVVALQDYGDALAGKSQGLDRYIKDRMGKSGQLISNTSSKLQGIAGASAIPGSATSALAQFLSLPQTIARDSPNAVIRASRDMLKQMNGGASDPMRKSAFMRARYTDASSQRKSAMRKYTDTASIPMQAIERFSGELSWRSAYHSALARKLPEDQAIIAADLMAKKTLAGRGIGDRPNAMNSRVGGLVTQFGLEVNNMRLQFFKDFTPIQKVKFMVAAAGMNLAYQTVTGNAQLPDFLRVITDSYEDLSKLEEDELDEDGNPKYINESWEVVQRMLGEGSKFIPGAGIAIDFFLNDKQMKTVFGEESAATRFGEPAAAKALSVVIDFFESAAEGKPEKAAKALLGILPTGGQIKRTTEGIEALNKGYIENDKGQIQTEIDNDDPLSIVQTAVFGKYSAKQVQDYFNNKGLPLSEDQSKVFKQLSATRTQDGKDYLSAIFSARDAKKESSGSAVSSPDNATLVELEATKKVNLAEGTWKEEDGILVNKNGEVQRDHYKKLAMSLGNVESDQAYDAYVKGYNLDPGFEKEKQAKKRGSSGDALLDSLLADESQDKGETSKVSIAMSLYRKDKKVQDVPDWVKERYYKDAGFSLDDVAYATVAAVSKDTKLDQFYRPFAQENSHEDLIEKLYEGRKESINRKYVMAQDSIITALRDEGFITKQEATYLKKIKTDAQGKPTEKSTASVGRAKGKGKKKKGKFDYKLNGFGNGSTSNSASLRELLKRAKLKQN